jgi:hypothetical protein
VFGALGTPASLASCVVTIFESRRWRSPAEGSATSSPAFAAAASVSASNITNTALPPGPRRATSALTSGCVSSSLQMSSIDSNSR